MRVTLVAAANKYTGAAAVAEHCCRALMAAGHETRFLFTGGNNLEERLRGEPWAEPALVKERSPARVRNNLRALRAAAEPAGAVICHLPHDHLLCTVAGAHRHSTLIRSFRSSDHLRGDPYSRWLARRAAAALLAHSGMETRLPRSLRERPSLALPVPLEERFHPGADPGLWRRRLAIPPDAPVVGAIGKVARGRGFELLLEAAARVSVPVHVLVIGHGEAMDELLEQADRLGIGERVHWAGYQERALPDLYAAMDVVLFLAAGSDHGHRAISEAQACARPVVTAAIPGVEDLVRDGVSGRIAAREPEAIAAAVTGLLADRDMAERLGRGGAEAAEQRRFEPSGRRLGMFLEGVCGRHQVTQPGPYPTDTGQG